MTVSRWIIDREEARGDGGLVAAKHPLAAEAGVEVLRAGGNAIDAAIVAALVLGVVEPFMSGIGGGGYLLVRMAGRGSWTVDFGMVAPQAATADMFPLVAGANPGMFGWPSVVDDASIHGWRSVAVPGAVDGFALALERFGTLPFADALAPAIRFADDGFLPSWHTALNAVIDLPVILACPETTAVFAPGGVPPTPVAGLRRPLRQPDLAATLRGLAAAGPRAFYEDEPARRIAAAMAANGGLLTEQDLAAYRARVVEPLRGNYRGFEVLTSPVASGGPTVLQTLNQLDGADLTALGHNSPAALHEISEACRGAFVDRFAWLADDAHVSVPIDALLSKAYAAERRAEVRPDRVRSPLHPGSAARLGAAHGLARSMPAYGAPRMTTTHVSVIDRDGNAASLTNTLLSGWGSGMMAPGTGVLLNNGMMWFDPEPRRPNSVAGGKGPLSNMAPTLILRDGEAFLSLGAMGCRRILNAIPQIVANVVDFGMGPQAAITAPRIDLSTGHLQASDRIPADTLEALRRIGYEVEAIEEDVLGFEFASPVAVMREPDGTLRGGANPYYPAWAVGIDDR